MRGLAIVLLATAAAPLPAPLDLAGPFAARSPWRVTVTQAPNMADPVMDSADLVPGPLALCLSRDGGRSCDSRPGGSLQLTTPDLFDRPHYLQHLTVVRAGTRPLLLVQVASLASANGDQRVGLELYAYDRATDRFRSVYARQTGRNNNQELRFVKSGPLRGAVIAAEPTADAPFGFWITVSRVGTAGAYRPVLRYRSVTRYGDGNQLAVIDSDMPTIHQRLGLWRPGRPLPTPPACTAPRLVRGALWCAPPR